MKTFPTLFHRGRLGPIYQWKVWADGPYIYTEYGQIGGAMQISKKLAEAKNVGRANATTPEQQAEFEAESLHTFKLERKYFLSVEECKETELLSPMLAPSKDFPETKKYLRYPCDIQPKLDGVRCLAYWENGEIILQSRGGKFYSLPHIALALKPILPEDAIFDGELYLHGLSCQTITSYVKKHNPGLTETIKYHVYDVPTIDGNDHPWSVRREYVFKIDDLIENAGFDPENYPVEGVFTTRILNENELFKFQSFYVQNGYEGGIARNLHGMYEWGYRSKNLLKIKNFEDHEFEIVGFLNGRGKNETTVTWECVAENGKTFTVVPKGDKSFREEMLRNGQKYIGYKLKVKHHGWTDDGLPRFPVGICIREDWD